MNLMCGLFDDGIKALRKSGTILVRKTRTSCQSCSCVIIYELLVEQTPDRGKAGQLRIDWEA